MVVGVVFRSVPYAELCCLPESICVCVSIASPDHVHGNVCKGTGIVQAFPFGQGTGSNTGGIHIKYMVAPNEAATSPLLGKRRTQGESFAPSLVTVVVVTALYG